MEVGKRVSIGGWGTMTVGLLGGGIPLAFGSPGLGIVLCAAAVVTLGFTIRAWSSPSGATVDTNGEVQPARTSATAPRRTEAITPTAQQILADDLTKQVARGNAILRNLGMLSSPPYATTEVPDVREITDDAVRWSFEVAKRLCADDRQADAKQFGHADGYGSPDEMEPEDTTVNDVELMLAASVRILDRIVHELL